MTKLEKSILVITRFMKIVTVAEAISKLKSNDRLFIQGAAATPNTLIKEMIKNAKNFKNIEIMHLHTSGSGEYAKPEYKENFKVVNLFIGANMRPYIDHNRIDYIPCFLSEIPELFKKDIRRPNISFIHVSPPDQHGFCSLGTSVDVARSAVQYSDLVIAQVNSNMPRVFGDGLIHESKIDFGVEVSDPIFTTSIAKISDVELKVGKNVASLVEDGATIQTGIGAIPDAVMSELTNHKNLGIHSEMWSDGALNLILKGVINNSKKKIHPNKSVSTFLMGSKKLYDFIHDNPSVIQLDVTYVNNPNVIARNKKVCAINSAVEVDLTGQVCADSIGHHMISGVGGQIDFILGANFSDGGKPIIALTSRTNKNISRIVPKLKVGAGVVTTRAHVHYIVTEYGIADLFGKTIGERAKALIDISHPDDREFLDRAWFEFLKS